MSKNRWGSLVGLAAVLGAFVFTYQRTQWIMRMETDIGALLGDVHYGSDNDRPLDRIMAYGAPGCRYLFRRAQALHPNPIALALLQTPIVGEWIQDRWGPGGWRSRRGSVAALLALIERRPESPRLRRIIRRTASRGLDDARTLAILHVALLHRSDHRGARKLVGDLSGSPDSDVRAAARLAQWVWRRQVSATDPVSVGALPEGQAYTHFIIDKLDLESSSIGASILRSVNERRHLLLWLAQLEPYWIVFQDPEGLSEIIGTFVENLREPFGVVDRPASTELDQYCVSILFEWTLQEDGPPIEDLVAEALGILASRDDQESARLARRLDALNARRKGRQ